MQMGPAEQRVSDILVAFWIHVLSLHLQNDGDDSPAFREGIRLHLAETFAGISYQTSRY